MNTEKNNGSLGKLNGIIKKYIDYVKDPPSAECEKSIHIGFESYEKHKGVYNLVKNLKSEGQDTSLKALLQLFNSGQETKNPQFRKLKEKYKINNERLIYAVGNKARLFVNWKNEGFDEKELYKFAKDLGEKLKDDYDGIEMNGISIFIGKDDNTDQFIGHDRFLKNKFEAAYKEILFYMTLSGNNGKKAIPLYNGAAKNAMETILYLKDFKCTGENKAERHAKLYMKLYNRFKSEISEIQYDERYILDKFFNVIDKLKKDEVQNGLDQTILDYKSKYLIMEEIFEALETNKNIIFHGAPGTGKTYQVKEFFKMLKKQDANDERFLELQFHPSFTYEDFIAGIRPEMNENNTVGLKPTKGVFWKFCEKAKENEEYFEKINDFQDAMRKHGCFVFIDEINRANLSQVFGETLSLIENEYRGEEHAIETQYSHLLNDKEGEREKFYIPKNLFFIGAMNDVDRSIDAFDLALRRRFLWIEKICDYDKLKNVLEEKEFKFDLGEYKTSCENLNKYISRNDGLNLGKAFEFGHTFFFKITDIKYKRTLSTKKEELFDKYLMPTLKEYMRSQFEESELEENLKKAKEKFKETKKEETGNSKGNEKSSKK